MKNAYDLAMRLRRLIRRQGKAERLATGFRFTEGPVWIAEERCLLFSDIPADKIVRLTADGRATVFREPSGNSNGLTRDREGRLIACEHGNRRVTRTERDGSITVLADRFEGKRLNSPNDVVVRSDGMIYFTDPPYGIQPHEQELPFQGIYRLRPETGELRLEAADFVKPNGLTFSSDESRLYVNDSGRRHIRTFAVAGDGALAPEGIFFDMDVREPGSPDGMKVDRSGTLYCAGPGGVWTIAPEGKYLETLRTPEKPSNCAWGDEGSTLYVTAKTSVYRFTLDI